MCFHARIHCYAAASSFLNTLFRPYTCNSISKKFPNIQITFPKYSNNVSGYYFSSMDRISCVRYLKIDPPGIDKRFLNSIFFSKYVFVMTFTEKKTEKTYIVEIRPEILGVINARIFLFFEERVKNKVETI